MLHVCAVSSGSAPATDDTMFESLNDPVDVLTAFVEGRMRPLRFRWQGRVVRVRTVTGEWTRREGQTVLRHYSVDAVAGESFELCYDPRAPKWVLTRAWTANAK